MKAWRARAGAIGPEPAGMDPSPMAISGTIWQREALHSAAHQFRLGLEGATPQWSPLSGQAWLLISSPC